jgi:hypothetical protein
LASAVEHRDFFDIVRRCTGRCIFGSVPQSFGRGVESINRFVPHYQSRAVGLEPAHLFRMWLALA